MRATLLGLCAFLLSACSGGSGKGLDDNGRPVGETPDPGDLPTLANIQARVFTPICTQCHVGAAAPRGLRLDSANAFNDLVNVSSREVQGLLRVEPFDPDNSYLVQKIEGTASVGGLMPLGGPPLPSEDILLIRQWITEGAMPDDTTALQGGASVNSIRLPGPSGPVNQPATITIGFTKALDATTVHAGSVLLTRSSDSVFGNEDDSLVAGYSVSMSIGNPFLIHIELPVAMTDDDWYRVTLGAPASATILDLSGLAVQPYQLELH